VSQSPLFSVVIPTYNRAGLLRAALDSVFRQEDADFEVIVVDDGSKEDLSAVAAEYAGRVTFLRQVNSGPAEARNYGARTARGEYVAFLDSDDVWLPWTLKAYREVIGQHDRPAFIAGRPQVFRDAAELETIADGPVRGLEFRDYYSSGDAWRWFGASSFVVRKDALESCGGFKSELREGEDSDLTMALGTARGFVQVVNPATFGYRDGSADQVTGKWEYHFRAAEALIANECRERYPGGRERAVDRRRIISRHVRPVAFTLLRERRFAAAWRLYGTLLPWNVRLGKWKFLLGFPVWAAWRQTLGLVAAPGAR
jgi:glycosyltransferase involved in cell wall biosynthesis